MFKEQSEFLKYLFIAFDFVLTLVAYGAAFLVRFIILDPSGKDLALLDPFTYVMLGIILAFNQIIAFSMVHLYEPRRMLNLYEEWASIIAGVGLNILISLALMFFFSTNQVSRALVLLFVVNTVVLTIVAHSFVRTVLRTFRAQGKNQRTALVLGSGHTASRTLALLRKNSYFGIHVLGVLQEDEALQVPGTQVLGPVADIEVYLDRLRPSMVIVALDHAHTEQLEAWLDVADMYGARLHIVPNFSRILSSRSHVENLDGLPIISVRDIPAREGLNRILKRLFDLIFSLSFLAVFSWLYIAIALAVKLSSKGPVFFKQDRVGLDGRVFPMLKFRSMRVQTTAASDTVWTTKGDPRVTAVGRFLRKSSLDEIPQFLNVLVGQMSVVGPRPERPFYVEQFKTSYRFFMRRHAVKAGVTGWAQINGLRGDTSIEDRLAADIYYIENWSLFLDLRIVLLTPFKGILNSNAY